MKRVSLRSLLLTTGSFLTIFNFSLYGETKDPIRQSLEGMTLPLKDERRVPKLETKDPFSIPTPTPTPTPKLKTEIKKIYQEGLKHQEENDPQKALEFFEEAALAGHANAAFYAATYYDESLVEYEISQDHQKAIQFYELALNGDNRQAAAYRLSQIHPNPDEKAKFRKLCQDEGYLIPSPN